MRDPIADSPLKGSCKAKAPATKSFKIVEAPPVLTFHLKRFNVNYNSWNGKARADKYTQHIRFPERLDIAPYMVDPPVSPVPPHRSDSLTSRPAPTHTVSLR